MKVAMRGVVGVQNMKPKQSHAHNGENAFPPILRGQLLQCGAREEEGGRGGGFQPIIIYDQYRYLYYSQLHDHYTLKPKSIELKCTKCQKLNFLAVFSALPALITKLKRLLGSTILIWILVSPE